MSQEKTFIEKIGPLAQKDMLESGILASVTIAQACLESGYGTTDLAEKANNIFGMKAMLSGNNWESVWDGKSTYGKYTKEQDDYGNERTVWAEFRKYPDISTNIKDHSCYLTGAMNGDKKRYEGLIGEKDYRKAIQIVKDGVYATDINYVDKICKLIEDWELTDYDEIKEENTMKLNLEKKYMTNNPCYKRGARRTAIGIQLHTIGCAQGTAEAVRESMNRPDYEAAVNAIVDADVEGHVLLTLPDWMRSWADGGYGNDNLYTFEIGESDYMRYTGGANYTVTNEGKFKADILRGYRTAVAFCAYLCQQHGWDPQAKLPSGLYLISSHDEGRRAGLSTAHVDPTHVWGRLGLSMDVFRADVKAAMEGKDISADTPQDDDKPNTPATGDTWYKVQCGAFEKKSNADKLCKELQGKGIDAFVRLIGNWYKVQCGAYEKKSNAEKMCQKLVKMGYAAFVATSTGDSTYNSWKGVCTGNAVNVRKGPGTSYGNITRWPRLNKGNEVLVIGESGDWYQVKIQNSQTPASGYTGYVSKQYIQ